MIKIQQVCVIWFMFETLLHLFVSPNFRKFFKSPLNLIDIFSSLIGLFDFWDILDRDVLDIFAIFRLIYLARLVRHFKSLRILIFVFKNSIKEIFALFIYILLAVIVFSSILYLSEKTDPYAHTKVSLFFLYLLNAFI
jgi:hypothetical protein